jgi:hypothetical protein
MWITPNLAHSGHDPVNDPVAALQASDTWLATEIPKILASPAYMAGGVIFLTWDQAAGRNGNSPDKVPMIIISPKVKSAGFTSNHAYSHANYLATVEDIFGFPRLGGAAGADNMMEFFAAPLVLQTVVSRKSHGAAGTFDLALGLVATNPTTEPRSGGAGGNHTVVFTFDQPLTGGTAAVAAGTAVASVPTFSGNSMIVPLSGVHDQQYVTVDVTNVASGGGGTGSASVRIGFLLGDVNQNRVVTLADLGLVNQQLAQFVTAANYLKDVNVSGTLSLADKGITNANLTKALPAP